jgi:hypothetical protein
MSSACVVVPAGSSSMVDGGEGEDGEDGEDCESHFLPFNGGIMP